MLCSTDHCRSSNLALSVTFAAPLGVVHGRALSGHIFLTPYERDSGARGWERHWK